MNKVLIVAWREFLETVKTRAFLIGSVVVPFVILAGTFGIGKIIDLQDAEKVPPRKVAVVDETGMFYAPLAAEIARYNDENPNKPFELFPCPEDVASDPNALRDKVATGAWYAYLVIPKDVLEKAQVTIGRKDMQIEVTRRLEKMLASCAFQIRCARHEPPINPMEVVALQQPVELMTVDVQTGEKFQGDSIARMLTPFAFVFLLFISTMGISQGLLSSVIEEKSSRVVEVLLSAVSPLQLMAGKILGMVGVGLVIILIWSAVGLAGARSFDFGGIVTPFRIGYVILYFIPGFLLFAALLGAIGSACNTIKDAQSMQFPISIITVIPMMLWLPITQAPQSTLAIVLSFIPPITPFIMILRICADPNTPIIEIIATLAVLWLSVGVAIWAAGKVFRVGILMYGKTPTPAELLKWIRYA